MRLAKRSSAVIVLKGKQILLVKRGFPPYRKYYSLVGGIKEENENHVQCALREVREEVGLRLHRKKLQLYKLVNRKGKQLSKIYTYAFRKSPKVKIDTTETVGFRFFDACELPAKIVPYHRKLLANFSKKLETR